MLYYDRNDVSEGINVNKGGLTQNDLYDTIYMIIIRF